MSTRLERQSLAELLRAIHESKQDARVHVEHDGEQSQLWCQCGDVVDARSARLAGSAAVYRMLSLESGRMAVSFAPIERARTVEASTPALLIEGARRLDECRHLRRRIGDTSAIFVASANAYAAGEAQLPPSTWQVLRAFDGVSSVVHDFETLTIISELLEQAWVIPKPAPTAPQWLPLGTHVQQRPELSFVPLAQSLRARFSQHVLPRRA
ncbi:MAG TPA: DUF4388 domain-containing protein, partial [Polyangiaceae bacterium]|nr:DUF4388 domain-containing protein [Polyangiaceae bacterium]